MRAFSFLGIAAIFGVLCYYVYLQGEQNLDKTRKQSIEQTPQAANMGAVEGDVASGKDAVVVSNPPATQLPEASELPPAPEPLSAEPVAGKEMEGKVIEAEPANTPAGDEATLPVSKIDIGRAWARPVSNPTGAAYITLTNRGAQDKLLSASTEIADSVEIHQTYEEDGIMKMRAEPVSLPAGGTVTLGPGGAHIMLIGLKKPLKDGDQFPLKLQFERGDALVDVKVGNGF